MSRGRFIAQVCAADADEMARWRITAALDGRSLSGWLRHLARENSVSQLEFDQLAANATSKR